MNQQKNADYEHDNVKDKNLTYLFYDIGTNTNYGTWIDTYYNGQIQRGDDYTTLIPVNEWDVRDINLPNVDMCIEFDINYDWINKSSFVRFLSENNPTKYLGQDQLGVTDGQWHNVKITRVGDVLNIVTDGESLPINYLIINNIDCFRLVLKATECVSLKYKNLVIYSIS